MNETTNPYLNWLNSVEFENSRPYGLPMNAPLELCDANGNTRLVINNNQPIANQYYSQQQPMGNQYYNNQPMVDNNYCNNYQPQYPQQPMANQYYNQQQPMANPYYNNQYCNTNNPYYNQQQPQYYPPQPGYGYNVQYAPTPDYGVSGMYCPTYVNGYRPEYIDRNDLYYQENPSSGMSVIEFSTGIICTRKDRVEGIKPQMYRNPREEYLEKMQEYRHNQITIMSKLYKIYCDRNNIEFNEEEAARRFDPFPDPPKPLNFATATPEEKKAYLRNQQVEKGKMLAEMFRQDEIRRKQVEILRDQAYQRIFETHDKLIGYKPGVKQTLDEYLEKAGALYLDALMCKARKARRNGTRYFSQNEYCAKLSQTSGKPVPINNLEDEYVSVKERLEEMRKKKEAGGQQYELCVYRTPDGKTSYVKEPVFDTEFERHLYFLEAVQAMKDEDDLMRAGK